MIGSTALVTIAGRSVYTAVLSYPVPSNPAVSCQTHKKIKWWQYSEFNDSNAIFPV